MNRLTIKLQNCHGIRELDATIKFNGKRAVSIYAPNGVMKTSFARTFADLANGSETSDHMFPERITVRDVKDGDGVDLGQDDVVVIPSYDEKLGPSETTSTLLIDADKRAEYEAIQASVDAAKADLIDALRVTSRSRKNVSVEVSRAFTSQDDSFFIALTRLSDEIESEESTPFSDVPYDVIWDEKVVAAFAAAGFQDALAEYVTRFNDLLDQSTYFGRDAFNFWHATNVTKSLTDNGFFKANHSVNLSADEDLPIRNAADLTKLIAEEKNKISEDVALKKKFEQIEKILNRNEQCRKFLSYISEHVELLPEMANLDAFKEKVWKSYLVTNKSQYHLAVEAYKGARKRKKEIEVEAAQQITQWEKVIETFNERFFVPFTLVAKNREKVMLGQEPVLRLGFDFKDGSETASVEKDALLDVLSTGEKKALYVLNILFEVESRATVGKKTLFIVDDLADSFDYKNKYAIIQYLRDISEVGEFRMLILTHNFDFYRTLESRFVSYKNCLMAQRISGGVSLVQAEGIKNPFIIDWKGKFFSEAIKRYASIPFVRNILEYTNGQDDPNYIKLTSLLHWKDESSTVSQGDLDAIFKSTFSGAGEWASPEDAVIDGVLAEADGCLTAGDGVNFENKIVLSVATRILAEKFMINAINDPSAVQSIDANQTVKLLGLYRKLPNVDAANLTTLETVVLMTPENIHVNSFMYEPILDMSDEHLRKLYAKVKELNV